MTGSKSLRRLSLTATALCVLCGGAAAQTLTIGLRSGPDSMEPQHGAVGARAEALRHVFDTLASTGDKLQLEPGLAVAWRLVDPTTWELKLREGVKFHDGSDFTAEDVKFSIERLPVASEASPGMVLPRRMKEAKIVDQHIVHIVTDHPAPALPLDLARLFIVSHKAGAGQTGDAAKGAFDPAKAFGTGPFRLISWTPKDELVLERYDGHWRGTSPWRRVVCKAIPDDAARVTALKAGHVDVIAPVPPADVATVEKDARLKIVRVDTPWVFALEFGFRENAAQLTAKDGSALPRNPFRDERVREALDLAIDRRALAEVAMEGLAKPADQMAAPGAPEFNDKLPALKPDLPRARQLLAEAGYPNGFRVTLAFTIDRLSGDRAIGTSVAYMLSRIGLDVRASPQSGAILFPARARGDHALAIIAERQDALAAPGRSLRAAEGYANPELDKLVRDAAAELDEAKRRTLLEKAAALLAKDRVALPLVAASFAWGLAKDRVEMPRPRADAETLAYEIVPARK